MSPFPDVTIYYDYLFENQPLWRCGKTIVKNRVVAQFQTGWLGSNEVSPQTLRFLGARKASTPATRI